MKDLFVIQNISPFYMSSQPDSQYLTKDMEQYKGINCTIAFKRVIDPSKMTVEECSMYMHFGNTNPKGLKCIGEFVKGIKKIPVEKNGLTREVILMDSDKIVKGGMVEIEYTTKVEGAKTHIVPTNIGKFIGHTKIKNIKKVEDKVTRLF